MWLLEVSGFVMSADAVGRAQCIVGKEIYDLMSMGGRGHSHAAHTHTHTHVHPCACALHTHSEMSGGFTFSVLNCLDGFYGLNGS